MDGPNLSSPLPRRTTAIFTKMPVAGMVKTRLCPPLRADEAAGLADAMLRDVVARISRIRDFHTTLYFAPDGARRWFEENFGEVFDQRPQVGEGLASRLAGYFREELIGTVGSTAVAIGSDAPLAPLGAIVEAHERLAAGADLVLGPDDGGGYYLIGMREPHTDVITEVTMSTSDMCARTTELARSRGLDVELVDPGYDVDVARDLERLRKDIAALDPGADDYPRSTAAYLEGLKETSA